MKKLACFMVGCLLLVCAASPASADTTVYITRTGSKYHTSSCQHLAASCIEISLADAVAGGYTPCKVCHPPLLSADEPAPTPTPKPTYHPLPTVNAAASVYAPAIATVSPTASPAPGKSSSFGSSKTNSAVVFVSVIALAGAAVYYHKWRIVRVWEEERRILKKLVETSNARIYKELEDHNYNALYIRCQKISNAYSLPTSECLRQVAQIIAADKNNKTAFPSELIDERAYNIMFRVVGDMLTSHKYNRPNGELSSYGYHLIGCLKSLRNDMFHAGYSTQTSLNIELERICLLTLENRPYSECEQMISAVLHNRG